MHAWGKFSVRHLLLWSWQKAVHSEWEVRLIITLVSRPTLYSLALQFSLPIIHRSGRAVVSREGLGPSSQRGECEGYQADMRDIRWMWGAPPGKVLDLHHKRMWGTSLPIIHRSGRAVISREGLGPSSHEVVLQASPLPHGEGRVWWTRCTASVTLEYNCLHNLLLIQKCNEVSVYRIPSLWRYSQ